MGSRAFYGKPTGTTPGTVAAGDDSRLNHPSRGTTTNTWWPLSCWPHTTMFTAAAFTKDQWRYMPVLLRQPVTVAALAVNTTVAATSGTATLIFGLWQADASMRPAALAADWSTYGSIDLTATAGQQTLTTAGLTIPAGEHWVGCAWTGTATGNPTISAHSGMHPSLSNTTVALNAAGLIQSVSGASAPDPANPTSGASTGPVVWARNP